MASSVRIAVVNHDAVFLRLIDRIFRSNDYTPILCPSGTAAHDIIAREQPDVIMIDTWLEVQDVGWTLLQTLRLDDATRHIPVLLCTADPMQIQRRFAEIEPVANFAVLAKPFDPEQLLAAVAKLLTPQPAN